MWLFKDDRTIIPVFVGLAVIVISFVACLVIVFLGYVAATDVKLFVKIVGALALAAWALFVIAAVTKWAWKTLF